MEEDDDEGEEKGERKHRSGPLEGAVFEPVLIVHGTRYLQQPLGLSEVCGTDKLSSKCHQRRQESSGL